MWFSCDNKYHIRHFGIAMLPAWWTVRYGMKFGRRFVFDPDYRNAVFAEMKRESVHILEPLHLKIAFVGDGLSSPDFGNATAAALFGAETMYPDDNYPWNRHFPEDMPYDELSVPDDITACLPYSEIIGQFEYQNGQRGTADKPTIPVKGILNEAYLLFGSRLLADCLADPDEARKVFEKIQALNRKVLEYTYGTLGHRHLIMVANCTEALISTALYKEILYEYDAEISRLATEKYGCTFGVHHCGLFDPYIEVYASLPNVTALEVGWGSDIRAVMDAFPDADVNYIVSVSFLNEASVPDARKKAEDILRAAGSDAKRLAVSAADLDNGPWETKLLAMEEVFRA